MGTFLLVSVSLLSIAQEPTPSVKLRWFGQSMFQLETTNGKKIVFDPHGIMEIGRTVVSADVVLISHWHTDHSNLKAIENPKAARIVQGLEAVKKGRPAEWKSIDEKIGQARIRTVGTYHDPMQGMQRGKNAVFIVEVDGLVFCHLGDLGHELSPEQVKAIGPIDVMMVPVGGIYTLNGEGAKKVAAQLKPRRMTIPMHYAFEGYDELLPLDEFLDGQPRVQKLPSNELVIPLEAKEGPASVIVFQLKR